MDRRIYLLKGAAILGVLVIHANSRSLSASVGQVMDYLGALVVWCVSLFLFCAGVLHGRSWDKHREKFFTFAQKRTLRLMLPWFFLTVLYAGIWQILMQAGLCSPTPLIPTGWWSKLMGRPGFHLYFLPYLLAISLLMHAALRLHRYAVTAVGLLALGWVLLEFRNGPGGGRTLGTLAYGLVAYAIGITARNQLSLAPLPQWNWLERIGEASGTIYLYHVPFLLSPFILVVAHYSQDPVWQLGGMLAVIGCVTALLATLHFALRQTRLQWLLL